MPTVAIENPEIMTVSFRQTRNDKDYGSCLWAGFNFDTKNYHLSIESDCGTLFDYIRSAMDAKVRRLEERIGGTKK